MKAEVLIHECYQAFNRNVQKLECIQNLGKLALWVHENAEDIKDTFRMRSFMRTPGEGGAMFSDGAEAVRIGRKSEHDCGTCACYAGHGPEAGIGLDVMEEFNKRPMSDVDIANGKDWFVYTAKVFTGDDLRTFDILFGIDHPNDPVCAVSRTVAFLRGVFYEELQAYKWYQAPVTAEDVEFLRLVAEGQFDYRIKLKPDTQVIGVSLTTNGDPIGQDA